MNSAVIDVTAYLLKNFSPKRVRLASGTSRSFIRFYDADLAAIHATPGMPLRRSLPLYKRHLLEDARLRCIP